MIEIMIGTLAAVMIGGAVRLIIMECKYRDERRRIKRRLMGG